MTILVRRVLLAAIVAVSVVGPRALAAGAAPGAPGANSVWGPSQKSFLGTSASGASRVYFTGYRGIVSEVFYPVLDTVETVDLQFLVGDTARTFVDEEKQQSHLVSRPNTRSMRWRAVTSNAGHGWRITKDVFTDPNHHALVMRATFEALNGRKVGDFNLYLLHNPAMDASGSGDTSRTLSASGRTMLVASQGNRASALAATRAWVSASGAPMVSSGFVAASDGWTDLLGGAADKKMDWSYNSAAGGNVAQMGWLNLGGGAATSLSFGVVLAFGATEAEAMSTADAVWARDLFKFASALVTAGDIATGRSVVEYLFTTLQLPCGGNRLLNTPAAGSATGSDTVSW